MDDFTIVDKFDIDIIETGDRVVLKDSDGMSHYVTIMFIDDTGEVFDITALSETTGEKEDFTVDYNSEVELWQWT